MCGHEKYLKTTMHGLTSLYPDYCLLVVGANMGISKMTKEHLGISWALNLPIIVVFTKLDLAPKDVYAENMKKIQRIIRQHLNKIPICLKDQKDLSFMPLLMSMRSATCGHHGITSLTSLH